MLRDGEHIIGRDADAVVLLDSPSVSRRHARIHVERIIQTVVADVREPAANE